jgi:large subunit ribosomal protein L17
MRHLKKTKKLKRTEEERRKLFVDLSTAVIESGQIVTFTTRAKWFRPKFERLITHVKKAGQDKNLAFRRVRPYLKESTARKLVEQIAPKYEQRDGGYLRILHFQERFSTLDKVVVSLVEA